MPEYWARVAMIQRCHKPNHPEYPGYGARGISVCGRWRESFQHFLDDVGTRPGPEYSLDRIDVNGNYEPGNVRWATLETQNNNKRCTIKITLRGVTMSLTQWCQKLGVSFSTAKYRLAQGWTAHDALLVGIDRRKLRQKRKEEKLKLLQSADTTLADTGE